jgi:sugar lactone lactonase YvrE
VTFDSSGNLYVANFHGNTISEVTQPNTVTTFSNVNTPDGLAFDPNDGNLYVSDKYDDIIYEVPSTGGSPSTYLDNSQLDPNLGLNWPSDVAIDSASNLYVLSMNNNTIFEVPPGGGTATDIVDGTTSNGLINSPTSLVFSPDGQTLYVYNSGTSEITTVTVNGTGGPVVSNFVQLDPNAAGTYPGLVFDPSGNLYITNSANNTISEIAQAAPPGGSPGHRPIGRGNSTISEIAQAASSGSGAGQAFSHQTVFHSSDADSNGTASQYKAVVPSGDGNSVTRPSTANDNGQIVANAGGGFDVQRSYTYAEELSNQTFSVQGTDVGGASTAASTTSFRVDDAPLTGSSAAEAGGSADVPNSSVLSGATFTDATPGSHLDDFTAVIDWGDGSATSSGTVADDISSGVDTVNGSHSYATAGSYPIRIAVTDQGGDTATITGTATVRGGAAGLTTSSRSVGTHSITMISGGDTHFKETSGGGAVDPLPAVSPSHGLASATIGFVQPASSLARATIGVNDPSRTPTATPPLRVTIAGVPPVTIPRQQVTQVIVSYDSVGNTGGAGSLATRRLASFDRQWPFPARNGTPLSFSRFPVAWRSSRRFGVDRVSDPIPSES